MRKLLGEAKARRHEGVDHDHVQSTHDTLPTGLIIWKLPIKQSQQECHEEGPCNHGLEQNFAPGIATGSKNATRGSGIATRNKETLLFCSSFGSGTPGGSKSTLPLGLNLSMIEMHRHLKRSSQPCQPIEMHRTEAKPSRVSPCLLWLRCARHPLRRQSRRTS